MDVAGGVRRAVDEQPGAASAAECTGFSVGVVGVPVFADVGFYVCSNVAFSDFFHSVPSRIVSMYVGGDDR